MIDISIVKTNENSKQENEIKEIKKKEDKILFNKIIIIKIP